VSAFTSRAHLFLLAQPSRDLVSQIERDVIARGIFTSVSVLARKLHRYINAYSADAQPIQWKYSDTSRRIRPNEFTATGH
jgi:hypothetical protein